MRTLEVLAAVVGTAMLVSCSSAPEQAAPSASLSPIAVTEAPSPTPTATDAPIDTAKVPEDPADIDAEYVQAVMDDVDAAIGEVFRAARKAGGYDEAWHAGMRSLYTAHAASQQTKEFTGHGFRRLARRPGNPTTKLDDLLEATPTCIFFTAEREISPLFSKPINPVQPYYLALDRGEPDDINPTAWVLAFESYFPEGGAPTTACEGAGA